tara:strand:- start:799 stop:1053 length:255 start_codon:yes stop_codon:yes gene_type:complete
MKENNFLKKAELDLYDRENREVSSENLISDLPVQDYPDAKLHQTISFIKSGIRILGYACLLFSIGWAVAFLILSEVVGIIEELV